MFSYYAYRRFQQNAPPPMPKTKLGIVLPAAEATSTVHTTGLMDRSAYARQMQVEQLYMEN